MALEYVPGDRTDAFTRLAEAFRAGTQMKRQREQSELQAQQLEQAAARLRMEQEVQGIMAKLRVHDLIKEKQGLPISSEMFGIPQGTELPQETPEQLAEKLFSQQRAKSKGETQGAMEGEAAATSPEAASLLASIVQRVATLKQVPGAEQIGSSGLAPSQLKQILAGTAQMDEGQQMTGDIPGVAKQGEILSSNELRARTAGMQERGAAGRANQRLNTLTPVQEMQETRKLAEDYKKFGSGAREARRQYSVMEEAIKQVEANPKMDLNAPTQAIITSFNKILDPMSVVRESEYARSAEGQAAFDRLQGKMQAIIRGGPGLTPANLRDFVSLAKVYVEKSAASLEGEKDRISRVADKYGLDKALIFAGDREEGGTAPAGNAERRKVTNDKGEVAWAVKRNGKWIIE